MKRWLIVGALALLAGLAAWLLARQEPAKVVDPPAPVTASTEAGTEPADGSHEGFLYGRVTTPQGTTYEGRLRWGGGEEAFWDDTFNGYKAVNPWLEHVPAEQLVEERSLEIFGITLARWTRDKDLGRPFMARFGDIARIDADGRDLRVTLRSGSVFVLDRFNADDLADGLRIWDAAHGVVNLEEWQIRSVELLPTRRLDAVPHRLHGTVRTAHAAFTGFVQWDRTASVGSDELPAEIEGETGDGDDVSLSFDSIRSIEKKAQGGSLVTLRDGRTLALSGTRHAGSGNRGVFVGDPRYGRVLVSWDAFERLDFDATHAAGSGQGFDDFRAGTTLAGTVTTQDGRQLSGRLVYDLDESETTETLDAPSAGVNYSIPFGRVASIARPSGAESFSVTLTAGSELRLEPAGDLGEGNAGLLVFTDGDSPVYVPWSEVARIDFDGPTATGQAE